MPLKLAQSDQLVRPGWWKWSVWLEGSGDELDRVSTVCYLLHPTFAEPVRLVSDRSSAFRLDSAGWGGFTIRAEARLHDGAVRTFHHALELHLPEVSTPPSDAPRVFLSHSAIDGRLAAQVSRQLESYGVKVISSAAAMSPSSPRRETVRTAVEHSHAFVALQSDTPSDAVEAELLNAYALGKPVVRVRLGAPPSRDASDNVLQLHANARPQTIARKVLHALDLSSTSTAAAVVTRGIASASPTATSKPRPRAPGKPAAKPRTNKPQKRLGE